MATFKRIKIQATVETAGMLLAEDQIPATCDALREKLAALDLAVLAVEPQEEPPVEFPEALQQELD